MTDTNATYTKILFESLVKLYKQGQLLLLDADRIMGEKGRTPITTTILSGLSYALGYPERWYLRWATRFYLPTIPEGEKPRSLISFHKHPLYF